MSSHLMYFSNNLYFLYVFTFSRFKCKQSFVSKVSFLRLFHFGSLYLDYLDYFLDYLLGEKKAVDLWAVVFLVLEESPRSPR